MINLPRCVEMGRSSEKRTPDRGTVKRSKENGIPGYRDRKTDGKTADEVKAMRKENNIVAAFKVVDTCAGEFADRNFLLLFLL